MISYFLIGYFICIPISILMFVHVEKNLLNKVITRGGLLTGIIYSLFPIYNTTLILIAIVMSIYYGSNSQGIQKIICEWLNKPVFKSKSDKKSEVFPSSEICGEREIL